MRIDFTQRRNNDKDQLQLTVFAGDNMATILLILSTGILVMLIIMTYRVHSIIKKNGEDEEKLEKAHSIQNRVYAALIFTIIAIIASIYFMVKGTVYEGLLMEWLNIVVRVMHFTFGIAWIGASFWMMPPCGLL